jgi:hypothetical protein
VSSVAIGSAVVEAKSDVFVKKLGPASQFTEVHIQNPRRALTLVFQTRKSLDEYYKEGRYFRGSIFEIYFDTDLDRQTGSPAFDLRSPRTSYGWIPNPNTAGRAGGPAYDDPSNAGFERLATVEAVLSYGFGDRALASWDSPAPWMGKPKKYLVACSLERHHGPPSYGFIGADPGLGMVDVQMSRAKV